MVEYSLVEIHRLAVVVPVVVEDDPSVVLELTVAEAVELPFHDASRGVEDDEKVDECLD